MASGFLSTIRTVYCGRHIKKILVPGATAFSGRVQAYSDDSRKEPEGEVPIPVYTARPNESMQEKKARLLYQSRKRGMLENGILLSTFAGKYLSKLTDQQIDQYDLIINVPSNDWDIFYWMVKKQPVPSQYDNEVMRMLQDHAANKEMEERFTQPAL